MTEQTITGTSIVTRTIEEALINNSVEVGSEDIDLGVTTGLAQGKPKNTYKNQPKVAKQQYSTFWLV